MSDELCFTFIIHHIVRFMSEINQHLKWECENAVIKIMGTSEYIKIPIFNL